jgi:enamine deaminase RidA (YjgF/YER057c/UK114 family)
MLTAHTPLSIAPPSSAYAHGVSAPVNARWLHISGQVGLNDDGTLAGDAEAQMETCWHRIFMILEDAGMTKTNIVKVTVFITDAGLVSTYRAVRDRRLEGHLTASSLLVVSALADPEWLVEIEAVAAG